MNAVPTTDTAYIQLLPTTNATKAAQDFANVRKAFVAKAKSSLAHWLIGVIVVVCVLCVLLAAGVAYCWCRRRRYRAVHEPSPKAADDLHI